MFCDLEPILYFEEENRERETETKRERLKTNKALKVTKKIVYIDSQT